MNRPPRLSAILLICALPFASANASPLANPNRPPALPIAALREYSGVGPVRVAAVGGLSNATEVTRTAPARKESISRRVLRGTLVGALVGLVIGLVRWFAIRKT